MLLKLSAVNLQLQGTKTHLADKIPSFIRKLEMWLQSWIVDNTLQNTHLSLRYFLMHNPKEYYGMGDPFRATPPLIQQ